MASKITKGLARIALAGGILFAGNHLYEQCSRVFGDQGYSEQVSETYQESVPQERFTAPQNYSNDQRTGELEIPQITDSQKTSLESEVEKPFTGTNWILERNKITSSSTIGNLYHDSNSNGIIDDADTHLAYTLELPWKNNNRNISSIPEGTYEVSKRKSPKFKTHFKVADVKGRSDILIHAGNYPRDTAGCILVGDSAGNNYVSSSRATLNNLLGEFGNDEIRMKVTSTQD
ncbi:hypothetical protein HN604_02970 [archaeon]|jgi:hypothetical protein|nr:hypothetical protein [archaeon]MBT6182290.1 hypothetical protein [archaeon]MBT6606490.1 hypothetical protein [archaeon]MBT7251345.1 hypothetical protein [archaeon]MBT7661020.1 hypothetical protein [archaeon]